MVHVVLNQPKEKRLGYESCKKTVTGDGDCRLLFGHLRRHGTPRRSAGLHPGLWPTRPEGGRSRGGDPQAELVRSRHRDGRGRQGLWCPDADRTDRGWLPDGTDASGWCAGTVHSSRVHGQ